MQKNRITIFVMGAIALSYLGAWIANGIDKENPALQVSGVLLMSMSPLLMTIVIKSVYREGWQDIGWRFDISRNKGWFLFSMALPLLLVAYVIALSNLSSSVSISDSLIPGLPQILISSCGLFFAFLVASIGEEVGWRGYLESALSKTSQPVILNHLMVGVVWFTWHLPLILSSGEIHLVSFEMLMILLSTLGLSVVYGQLRIRSKTVWTCVVLHACSNAFIIGFGSSKPLVFENDSQYYFSLSSFSAAVVSFWTLVALCMFAGLRQRSKTQPAS